MRIWSGALLGVVLIVTWVVAYLVMKVSSAAIHILLFAAAVAVVMNVVGRLRGGSNSAD